MKFCPECGTKLMPGGSFCPECGFRISGATDGSQGQAPDGVPGPPPEGFDGLSDRAREALRSGDLQGSLAILDRLTAAYPGDARVWNNKGLVHSKLGQYESAVTAFDRALELDGDNGAIWFGKGSALYGKEDFHGAAECYGKALGFDPSNGRARARLEKCRAKTGKQAPDDAVADADESEPCPVCSAPMRHWEGNWWCDSCNEYPYLESKGPETVVRSGSPSSCPTCGGGTRFIEKYGRNWCDSCRKYAPRQGSGSHGGGNGAARAGPAGGARGGGSCAGCGSPLRYIQEYNRYWCDTCRTYA